MGLRGWGGPVGLSLSMSALQVPVPQQDRLLRELLALSCACDCPFAATAAAKCFAGLVNKHPEGEWGLTRMPAHTGSPMQGAHPPCPICLPRAAAGRGAAAGAEPAGAGPGRGSPPHPGPRPAPLGKDSSARTGGGWSGPALPPRHPQPLLSTPAGDQGSGAALPPAELPPDGQGEGLGGPGWAGVERPGRARA